ncbi:MAG: heterocyst frequency control protein PatD, partial [Dolichospermum sp.]
MSLNCDKYQELATFLDELQTNVTINQLDIHQLRLNFTKLQTFFLHQIVPLVDDNSQQLSYKTEISKQLRLLEVDIMFLQGARHSTTLQARLKNIEERINTLIRYCQAII